MKLTQTAWVMLALVLVFLGWMLMLSQFPIHHIYPALLVAGSLLLTLTLVSRRFEPNLKDVFKLKGCTWHWWVLAMLLAITYWRFDSLLMAWLDASDQNKQIAQWLEFIKDYPLWMVFLSTVVITPWLEEWLFRGLLLGSLSKYMHVIWAASITALLFSAIHYNWPEAISIFLVGIIYATLTIKSGSIWPATLAHIIHNGLTFWRHVFV